MRNLIDGILRYCRVGRAQAACAIVDLNQVVPEVVDLLAVPESIEVTIDKPLPTVVYEPILIQQIFQNLLSNAIKYIDKPQGRVHIDYTEDDDTWTFSVSDNGPGIETQYFDKIFGMFQTLTSRDQYESTGVGLAVVKKSVELAGGRIWVTSEVGQGATFYFTVPKGLTPTAQTPEPEAPQVFLFKPAGFACPDTSEPT